MALLVEKTTQVITNTRSMTFPRATPMLLQHLLHPRSRHCHYCTERALNWGPDGGPNLIVDDNSDATFLIHEGVKVGKLYEKTDELLDPNSTDNAEFQIVLTIIRDGLKTNPTRYCKMKSVLWGFKPPLKLRGSIKCNRMTLFSSLLLMSMTLSPTTSEMGF
ncbi:hypothetical protein AAZV13_09G077500 [Glycine max]